MNVLFVDDQINVLNGIASGVHFSELGIENVYYATGSAQAMEILDANPVNIMLCDVEMPGEDGLTLNRRVMGKYPDILRILLTSHADFEYAQESTRLGCFDYLLQPAPYEEIELCLKQALQAVYEREKSNHLIAVGKAMQTSEMELLDRVTMNLFSASQLDRDASVQLLQLLGYPMEPDKRVRILLLQMEQFRKTDTPIVSEREIHAKIFHALKQAGITYPIQPLSTVDHHRQFIVLLTSARNDDTELATERCRLFFDCLCKLSPKDVMRCTIGMPTTLMEAGSSLRKIYAVDQGKTEAMDVEQLQYNGERSRIENSALIPGRGSRWSALLVAGQKRILQAEFDDCMEKIIAFAPNRQKALCDLHQRVTHIFLDYFYGIGADTHQLFRDQYSYTDFMGSFADPDSLRSAFAYMMHQVDALKAAQPPLSDVEKAKSFIADNIADPITVRDVADHVCLSAEYFTKLFKRETGQNIKEYITLTKIEAAKEMLEHASISVGMVALELGYTNFSHFSQVFRKYEDMTPSEYRQRITGKTE